MLPKQLTIVDLFSGAGGLSLGASRAGFEVRGAVDTDPQALEAHRTNFSNARHIEADVSDLDVDSFTFSRRVGRCQVFRHHRWPRPVRALVLLGIAK